MSQAMWIREYIGLLHSDVTLDVCVKQGRIRINIIVPDKKDVPAII